ncbi:hypothetical protein VNI00_000464 [Paramarasmius palmivorus]|uniref:HMG domain-containing protein n=1 Tax=Paramarasmius palmivorus TaxID=297713 RepID=A0AAW0E9E6_9AGAR
MYPYRRASTPPPNKQSYPGRPSNLPEGLGVYPGRLHTRENDWLRTPSPQKATKPRKRIRHSGRNRGGTSNLSALDARGSVEQCAARDRELAGFSNIDNGRLWDNDTVMHDLGEEEDGLMDMGELDRQAEKQPEVMESLEAYIEMVTSGCAKYIQISKTIYAVQGWNVREQEPTDDFYHLEARMVGDRLRLVCLCPEAKKDRVCVHQLYYLDFRDEMFRDKERLWFTEKKVTMFWRQRMGMDQGVWLTRFSVTSDTGDLNGRAMVVYEGPDAGGGHWKCSKDKVKCGHVRSARAVLRTVLGIGSDEDSSNEDEDIEGESYEGEDKMFATLVTISNISPVGDLTGGRDHETAISFLPIMPPKWAFLPTDSVLYVRADPTAEIPPTIGMHVGQARGSCLSHPEFDPNRETTTRPCKVYTYTSCVSRLIEVQRCPTCPPRRHCFIGPDPRALGIFNYNNSVLFSHELLDEYTNRSGTSETPFAAFAQCSSRVFEGRGSKFVGEDLLREAWFAYVSIQRLTKDMMCPRCGDHPENMIFDGVTLGFHKKHLTDSLKPPTFVETTAPLRRRKYPIKPQWLPCRTNEKPIRERLRVWIKAQRSGSQSKGKGGATPVGRDPMLGHDNIATTENATMLVNDLQREAPELAALVKRIFTDGSSDRSTLFGKLRKRYITLIEQLAAEESTVQMVNSPALECLKTFAASPTERNGSALVDVPALFTALEGELSIIGGYTPELLEVCKWMVRRAEEVLNGLKETDLTPIPTIQSTEQEEDWREVRIQMTP